MTSAMMGRNLMKIIWKLSGKVFALQSSGNMQGSHARPRGRRTHPRVASLLSNQVLTPP